MKNKVDFTIDCPHCHIRWLRSLVATQKSACPQCHKPLDLTAVPAVATITVTTKSRSSSGGSSGRPVYVFPKE